MNCPRCAAEVAEPSPESPYCGVVFGKARSAARPPRVAVEPDVAPPSDARATRLSIVTAGAPPAPTKEFFGVPLDGWKAGAIGLAIVVLISAFPLLSLPVAPL